MPRARVIFFSGIFAAILIAIASANGLFGAGSKTAVLVEPVVRGTVEETVVANGTIEPARIVSVGAQVSGQLTALHVELGQPVKTGDLIAEIDATAQTNALRIAEANLANVTAQRKARLIQLRQAEQNYIRQKTMARQKAASTAEVETAESGFKALQAETESLEAQINQVTVELENAKANLGYTKVRAPMDGVVISIPTRAGQTLNSNQAVPTIVVLARLDVMRIKVQISEADIGRVKPGLPVRFTTMGNTRTPVEGALEQIEPAPAGIANDPAAGGGNTQGSGTGQGSSSAVYFNALFSTPNPDGRLRPMMTALVTIIVGRADNVPLVPWAALTAADESGRYPVLVRSASGEISERLVAIGITDRIKAEVVDGLEVGDNVVIPADGQAVDFSGMVAM